jgi:hypothetical protein
MLAIFGVMSCGTVQFVSAGTIDGFIVSGPGTVSGFPLTSVLNNDNVFQSANIVVLSNTTVTGMDPLDIEFQITTTGGVTEYSVTETVNNSSGVTWTGYRFELGFGTGQQFLTVLGDDSLDFDTPDMDSATLSASFPTLVRSADVLTFSGANALDGASLSFQFSIDVPDPANLFGLFTLRQTPIAAPQSVPVPEPATAILFGGGLLAAALTLRRDR